MNAQELDSKVLSSTATAMRREDLEFARSQKRNKPYDEPLSDIVLYDGQCRFCQRQISILEKLDRGNLLTYMSLHDPEAAVHFPGITHEDMLKQMWVATASDQILGGIDAVRYLTRRLPRLWIVAPILHIPGTRWLWAALYRFVARNRYRFGGKICDDDSCEIHFRK